MWFNEYEFTYGITDRIEAAGYLDLAKPNAHGLTYAGSKFRLRGRLFDEAVLPVDLGWYFEIEYRKNPQFNDATLEFEMRIPMQKDIGPFSVLFNPIFEKPVTGSEKHLGFEFGYSAGVYYRWMRALSPGIEFYGAFEEWLRGPVALGRPRHQRPRAYEQVVGLDFGGPPPRNRTRRRKDIGEGLHDPADDLVLQR